MALIYFIDHVYFGSSDELQEFSAAEDLKEMISLVSDGLDHDMQRN